MVSRLWEKAGSCTKSRVDFAFWAGKGWILHKVEVGFCILDEKSWILHKIR